MAIFACLCSSLFILFQKNAPLRPREAENTPPVQTRPRTRPGPGAMPQTAALSILVLSRHGPCPWRAPRGFMREGQRTRGPEGEPLPRLVPCPAWDGRCAAEGRDGPLNFSGPLVLWSSRVNPWRRFPAPGPGCVPCSGRGRLFRGRAWAVRAGPPVSRAREAFSRGGEALRSRAGKSGITFIGRRPGDDGGTAMVHHRRAWLRHPGGAA